MSHLIEFYQGNDTDHQGRSLTQIRQFNDDEMESIHDFIQWMFPLQEPSRFNPDAPLLTTADIAEFRSSPQLRAELLRSLDRFLTFLGLERHSDEITPGTRYSVRSQILNTPNHNWLRITRVLHCLRLLGLESEGRRLFECLEGLQTEGKAQVAPETMTYWREAMEPATG
jgi:hypothetical protein